MLAVWWNWLAAVPIASHNMPCLTWTKLDFFFSSLHPKRAEGWIHVHSVISVISIDFHRSRCASFFALNILVTGFRILPSLMWRLHLDGLAGNGMKKGPQSSIANSQFFFCNFEILQIQWLETDVLRLRCHSNRKIGKDCEHVNFKRKSFCWKRLALFDIELELVRSRIWRSHGNVVSQLHVSLYALGPLVTFSFKQSCTSSNG